MAHRYGQSLPKINCGYCRKIAYASRALARQHIRRLYPGDRGLKTYLCPYGGVGWHIGHPTPDQRKAAKKLDRQFGAVTEDELAEPRPRVNSARGDISF